MNIFPAVKKISIDHNKHHIWQKQYLVDTSMVSTDLLERFSFLKADIEHSDKRKIQCNIDQSLGEEAYQLIINTKLIEIHYSTEKGLFYACITLEQLINNEDYHREVPCMVIDDEPELSIRGFMLDISRNKIPSTQTIMRWIDAMAKLKYNHLELYVEGMSFFYPSLKHIYQNHQTPLTPEEFSDLQRYAKKNMIDLVPCHNGLGHMTEWLTHFPHLAELPEGMYMWGAYRKASTLNPLSEESYEFVKTLYEDSIKFSISSYFHMNLDEPYELGHGKSKEKADKFGVGQVYLDYLLKLYHLVTTHGKTPLVWGDVLNHYPETLEKLPKDLIFVDWGYDYDYPFYQTLKRLSEKNVRFMAAPGTSSWNSVSGRTDDMLKNIEEACRWTKTFHGMGILLTDWGDNGHWQQPIISYPALVFAGLESWRSHHQNRHMIKYILNHWFSDAHEILGKLIIDLGTYERFQPSYLSNRTALMELMILHRLIDKNDIHTSMKKVMEHHPFNDIDIYHQLKHWLEEIKQRRTFISLHKDSLWVQNELDVTMAMLESFFDFIIYFNPSLSEVDKNALHNNLSTKLPELIDMYQKVWLSENKPGGLSESIQSLIIMNDFIVQSIQS